MAAEPRAPRELDEADEFLGELRLGRRLRAPGHTAARGLAATAGILLLASPRLVDGLGLGALGAVLLGFLVMVLTLASILELLGGTGERGGTYFLVDETLGGVWGFLAGWSLLAAFLLLGTALARAVAGHLLILIPEIVLPSWSLGLVIFGGVALAQLLRILPRSEWLWPAVVGLALAAAVPVLIGLDQADPGIRGRTLGAGGLLRGTAWVALVYLAVELVLATRRHVLNPSAQLPRALVGTWGAAAAGFLLLSVLLSGLIPPSEGAEGTGLADALSQVSGLPLSLTGGLAGIAALLAANACLVASARQIHALSQRGGLPAILRIVRRPFRLPPLVFFSILAAGAPLIIWAPQPDLIDGAASLALLSLGLVNAGAIHSRRSEPERRRRFVVPLFPLAPGAAIALAAASWIALPPAGILASGVWTAVGVLLFLGYARTRQARAKSGIVVFGQAPEREEAEEVYRILVPLRAAGERRLALRIATSLARQQRGEVIPLQVVTIADPLAIEEGQRVARERNTLFQWSTGLGEEAGVPTYPITRLARSVAEGILDTATEENCDLILLTWSPGERRPAARLGPVLDPVTRLAPCDVAVVVEKPRDLDPERHDDEEPPALRLRRIVVPTAGGPHAPLATRLATILAEDQGATATALYVADTDASDEDLRVAQGHIDATLAALQDETTRRDGDRPARVRVEQRVVRSENAVTGISEASADADLVLIGASELGLLDQVLFGTIPEQVALASPSPVIMVKRYRGLPRFWLQRTWDAIFLALPTLTRDERVEVYKQVRRSARPDVDFFVMIGLAAVIATYGLLQDATAVIIGAMLVAPLFAPVLALSLAVVQGDVRLLRISLESALKGIAVAVGVALLLTLISPLREVTHEIAARTQPNLFDLAIALASGAAGSYAIARRDVGTALPGVAIAVALLPPLGVVGIGLALGDGVVARGGGLLFATNLIAIVLAGTVTLLLLGFRPRPRGEREARLRLGLVVAVGLVIMVTIPLAAVVVGTVERSQVQQTIQRELSEQLSADQGLGLAEFEFRVEDPRVFVSATVYSESELTPTGVERLRSRLSEALGRAVQLEVTVIPVQRIESS